MTIEAQFRPLTAPAWLRSVQFLARLAAWQPRVVSAATLTVTLLGLVEGLALALLIPLLGLLGLDTGATPKGPVLMISKAFEWAGIPLTLVSVLAIFAAVGLAQVVLYGVQQYLIIHAGERLTYALRVALFDAAARTSWPGLLSMKSGHLSSAMINESSRLGVIYGNSVSAAGLIVLLLLYAGMAAWLSWQFTLAVLAIGIITTLALRRLYASSRRFGAFSSSASGHMEETLLEHLRAAKLIRITNATRWSVALFNSAARAFGDYMRRTQVNNVLVRASVEPMVILFVVIVLYVAITYGTMPAAQTLVFLAILYRLAPRMILLQQLAQRIAASLPSYELIGETFARLRAAAQRTGGVPFAGLHQRLSVSGLSVDADGSRLLHDVSFTLPARSIAAIIGPSGAGKSTLLDVVFGVRERAQGEIRFDGTALDELDLGSLHSSIGYVPQDGQFFHDTIASNLRLTKPEAREEELWEALDRAQAREFVQSFPEGLQTMMGAQGFKLSGGQRQRLALARALLSNPSILILDEPTSALDSVTEQAFMESLLRFRGRMTIIIVAHRGSLVQHADVVLRVENGRLEVGQQLAPVGKLAP